NGDKSRQEDKETGRHGPDAETRGHGDAGIASGFFSVSPLLRVSPSGFRVSVSPCLRVCLVRFAGISIKRLMTARPREKGRGIAKRSQLFCRQGRSKANPMHTIGICKREAKKIDPSARRRR